MTTILDAALLSAEEVYDARSIDEICRFRASVWRGVDGVAAGAFPDGTWRDEMDDLARHWVVRDAEGRLVGAARLTVHRTLANVHEAYQYLRYDLRLSGAVAAPDRVVVSPETRRRGVAALLLNAQDAAAIQQGASHAVRQASAGMARLIARRGWRLIGPALLDQRFPGIEFTVAAKDYQAG